MMNTLERTIKTTSRALAGVGGLACALTFLGGCNCSKTANEMEERQNRFIAQRKKCCDELRDLGQTEEAAKCYRKVESELGRIQELIGQWEMGCHNNNQGLMNTAAGALKAIAANDSCPPGNVVATTGKVACIASPFANVDLISLEMVSELDHSTKPHDAYAYSRDSGKTMTRAQQAVQRLNGSFSLTIEDAAFTGVATGLIAWQPGVSGTSDGNARVYKPTNFKVKIATDLGPVSFGLLPHASNRISVESNGNGILQARVSLKIPSNFGIALNEAWVEIPIHKGPQGISLTAVDVPGLEFAPQAPHAWADWNGDWNVDLQDYTAYLQDFADGKGDLNFDNESTDEDVAIFEYYFYMEYDG